MKSKMIKFLSVITVVGSGLLLETSESSAFSFKCVGNPLYSACKSTYCSDISSVKFKPCLLAANGDWNRIVTDTCNKNCAAALCGSSSVCNNSDAMQACQDASMLTADCSSGDDSDSSN